MPVLIKSNNSSCFYFSQMPRVRFLFGTFANENPDIIKMSMNGLGHFLNHYCLNKQFGKVTLPFYFFYTRSTQLIIKNAVAFLIDQFRGFLL